MSHDELNQDQDQQESSEDMTEQDSNQSSNQTEDAQSEASTEVSEEVAELSEKNQELSDRVLRLQAEVQNLQRRNTKNREELQRFRSMDLAKDIIPSIDNLERAMQIEVDTEAGENLKKGLEMVLNSLLQGLEKNHVTVIDPKGENFDPNYHEAYTTLPAKEGQESGQVAEVFEKGYKLHDRVLRSAKVVVVQ